MSDKCPKCGMKNIVYRSYFCGSFVDFRGKFIQSRTCKRIEKLERVRKAAELINRMWLSYPDFKDDADSIMFPTGLLKLNQQAIAALETPDG